MTFVQVQYCEKNVFGACFFACEHIFLPYLIATENFALKRNINCTVTLRWFPKFFNFVVDDFATRR